MPGLTGSLNCRDDLFTDTSTKLLLDTSSASLVIVISKDADEETDAKTQARRLAHHDVGEMAQ